VFVGKQFLSATVKELLKLDSVFESYAQMNKRPVVLTHSVVLTNAAENNTTLLRCICTSGNQQVSERHS